MAGLTKDTRTGLYLVQFFDADRSPRRKKVSTGVREGRSADRLRRFWETAFAEGRYDPWTDPPPVPGTKPRPRVALTLAEARARFLVSRAHRAENTRANYERVTGWFVDHTGGERAVGSITAADIQGWVAMLEVKPVTRANYIRHLRAFFRYCRVEGLTASTATDAVRLERVPRQFPKALRPVEVETVAAYAEAHARDGKRRSSAWAAPFIRLGVETAMRRGELLALRWDHVDIGAGYITVACTDAFTTKSGAERRIPLSARAGDLLAGLRNRPSVTGHVFESAGKPVDGHTCSDVVARFARKAGVPALTPHVLRHSCITWLIERGVPVPVVQRFAGHVHISTTMLYCSVADAVYGDVLIRALDKAGGTPGGR